MFNTPPSKIKARSIILVLCLFPLVSCRLLQKKSSDSSSLENRPEAPPESRSIIDMEGSSLQTRDFVLPSGNIYCALIGEDTPSLRCEIASFLNPLPPQPEPSACEFDWGAGFLLPANGSPEVLCISDTIAGSNNTLSYGKTWKNDGFECESETIGLKCFSQEGNGFFLSRDKWEIF